MKNKMNIVISILVFINLVLPIIVGNAVTGEFIILEVNTIRNIYII